jgi:hypothetical protein
VAVEFSDLAFHFRSSVGLGEEEQDALLDSLHRRVEARERAELSGLARSGSRPGCWTHLFIGAY